MGFLYSLYKIHKNKSLYNNTKITGKSIVLAKIDEVLQPVIK